MLKVLSHGQQQKLLLPSGPNLSVESKYAVFFSFSFFLRIGRVYQAIVLHAMIMLSPPRASLVGVLRDCKEVVDERGVV